MGLSPNGEVANRRYLLNLIDFSVTWGPLESVNEHASWQIVNCTEVVECNYIVVIIRE